MLLNPWSIALIIVSLLVISLMLIATRTAVRVLLYWDISSDDNRQIRLENETWLASTLVQYALGFQVASLIIFAMAADQFSKVIVGAMCATGSLTANEYGMPLLLIKLVAIFFYGFWIVLHQLDISSERYPLLKIKYWYLLCLLPFLLLEIVLQFRYINLLEPDIITSCCAVVFGGGQESSNLIGPISRGLIVPLFYGLAVTLFILAICLIKKKFIWLQSISGFAWLLFLPLALVAVTTVFSSYVYAMPYHRCPFCILKPEYNYVGFIIYGSLLPAGFFGMSSALLSTIRCKLIQVTIQSYQKKAALLSLLLLTVFLISVSFHYVTYSYLSGEW